MQDCHISPLTERYPELYHYTNAQGLQGIVESQQLHATDINYLNDAEEHIHFCKKRLPELLRKMLDESSGGERSFIADSYGSTTKFEDNMLSIFSGSLPGNSPFTVSFSIPPSFYPEDGLLSQWRAYGPDGGYAIVFSTEGLVRKVQNEHERFVYSYGLFAPVYYGQKIDCQEISAERIAHEEEFIAHLKDIVLTNNLNKNIPPLQEKLALLSVLFKHRGFREEQEFRLAFLRPNPDTPPSEMTNPINPLRFRPSSLKPYIALFEEKMGLPIKHIIVGPHPDKEKRKAAVEALLRQNGFTVDKDTVTLSSIPYLGI